MAAIANDSYTPGQRKADYSTTGLLRPPRIAQLQRQHKDELTEDVSDRIWSLFGQVVHTIIERAATNELVEHRLFMEIDGKVVSGQVDLYEGDTLWDWKTTSIYSGKDGAKKEWIEQGNINRLLCAENGIAVNKIQYVALYRDWSQMAAQRKSDYPEKQIEVFSLPKWPLEESLAFVSERIALHEAAKIKLPLCSDEERWAKPEKWALKQKGRKKALKLYDTEGQATVAMTNDKLQKIEHRPSEQTRCLFYCPVSTKCQQFREMIKEAV